MALFGISIRHGLNPEAAPTAGSKTPTRDMLTQHWRQVLRVALLNIGFGVAFYTVLVYAVTNVELMHRGVRCTGLAFAYNLSVGVFGGLTPMVVTWLTVSLKRSAAPGYWMAAGAAISAITRYTSVGEARDTPV